MLVSSSSNPALNSTLQSSNGDRDSTVQPPESATPNDQYNSSTPAQNGADTTNTGAALLILDRRVNSSEQEAAGTRGEAKEVVYTFPADLLSNSGLMVRLRGVFITLAGLLGDTVVQKERSISGVNNFFTVQLLDPTDSPIIVNIHSLSTNHLLVLALPVDQLPGQSPLASMETLSQCLLTFLVFFLGEDPLTSLNSSPFLTQLLHRFFHRSASASSYWPLEFTLPPQRGRLSLEDQTALEDALLPLEAGIGLTGDREDEGRDQYRPAVLIGCALLASEGSRLLIGHLPLPLLDQACRLCRLLGYACHGAGHLVVQWFPIAGESTGGLLVLEEAGLQLVMALKSQSNQILSGPPAVYIETARTRLTELAALYQSCRGPHQTLNSTLANPADYFEHQDPSEPAFRAEKDESSSTKYNLQWLKSQMSPRSLRKATSSLAGSLTALNTSTDQPQQNHHNWLMTGSKSALAFVYLNHEDHVCLCALPTSTLDEHRDIRLQIRRALQTCLAALQGWPGLVETSVGLRMERPRSKLTGKEKERDVLSMVIVGRLEKEGGQAAMVCYPAGCPQNVKELMDRLARHATLRCSAT